jgi:hypothetical protein
MNFNPGSRWESAVCKAQIVIVRPPAHTGRLQCGGHDLLPAGAERTAALTLSPDYAGGVLVGKRYVDPASGVEVLVSRTGDGSLSFDGRPLLLKEAKSLPSSD